MKEKTIGLDPSSCWMKEFDRTELEDRLSRSLREFIRKVADRLEIVSFKIPGDCVFKDTSSPAEILNMAANSLAWSLTNTSNDGVVSALTREWYEENRVVIAEYLLTFGC